MVERLRHAAGRQGDDEPFSLDALERLILFADPILESQFRLDSGPTGANFGRMATSPPRSISIYFVSLINVQYVITRSNPWHVELGRGSPLLLPLTASRRYKGQAPFSISWPIAA